VARCSDDLTFKPVTRADNICELPLAIRTQGELRPSYTTLLRTCAYGVVLDTKLVGPERVHLNSHYLGDPNRTARSTHFSDAPGRVPVYTGWHTIEHPAGELDVRWAPSGCLYDHLQRLLDLLERLGRPAKIDVSDEVLLPFEALAQGLSVASARPQPAPMHSGLAAVFSSWSVLGPSGQRHAEA
jgi:hypothetical protein